MGLQNDWRFHLADKDVEIILETATIASAGHEDLLIECDGVYRPGCVGYNAWDRGFFIFGDIRKATALVDFIFPSEEASSS